MLVSRLKPLDIETMKRLGSRVNLIPVIAKADTMTPQDIIAFKENVRKSPFPKERIANRRNRQVRKVIAAQGIKVYVPPVDADDEASAEHSQALMVSSHHVASASITDDQCSRRCRSLSSVVQRM